MNLILLLIFEINTLASLRKLHVSFYANYQYVNIPRRYFVRLQNSSSNESTESIK